MSRLTRTIGLAALAGAAALYFLRTIDVSLESLDEGMIVNAIWRTALGALPYVDFPHIYGPSLFFLNGALFRLFGFDLLVIRLGLLVLKAVVVVEVYVLARTLAPRGMALVAAALQIAVWGAPIWLFNVPYAIYYATPLCLAGLLLLRGGRDTLPRLALAGLAFGSAATFKQTQGLFAFLSTVLLVVFTTGGGDGTRRPRAVRVAGSLVRGLALLAVGAVALGYVGARLGTPTALLLLAPIVASCIGLARGIVREGAGDAGVTAIPRLIALALGMAVPLAAYAALYVHHGALGALTFDMLAGLPQRITWSVPLQPPTLQTVFFAALVLATFAVVSAWQHRTNRPGRETTLLLLAALAALAASAALLGDAVARGIGLRPWLLHGIWPQEFYMLLPWLPFPLLAIAIAAVLRRPAGGETDDVALLAFFAAGAVLQLHPAADLPHALMILPAVLPLLAYALARYTAAFPRGSAPRVVACALAVAWPVVAGFPFVRNWLAVGRPADAPGARFARASGITGGTPKAAAEAEVVRVVPALAGHGGTLLVLSEERLLYFLADMPSALPHDEYLLYLVGGGLITWTDAHALADEDAMIDAIAAATPVVVDADPSAAVGHVHSILPRVAAFLDQAYVTARTIGPYRLRVPRARAG